MLNLTIPTRAESLLPGDVVLFEFPIAAASGGCAKARPCLVFDLRTLGGTTFVELAYGTTRSSRSNRGYEVRINHPEDYEAAGLRHPTRFIGARRAIVHPSHSGFTDAREGTPCIGQLPAFLMERLIDVRKKSRQAKIDGWRHQPRVEDLSDAFPTFQPFTA